MATFFHKKKKTNYFTPCFSNYVMTLFKKILKEFYLNWNIKKGARIQQIYNRLHRTVISKFSKSVFLISEVVAVLLCNKYVLKNAQNKFNTKV